MQLSALGLRFQVFIALSSIISHLQSVICHLSSALCHIRYELYALYTLRYAPCPMPYSLCSMRSALFPLTFQKFKSTFTHIWEVSFTYSGGSLELTTVAYNRHQLPAMSYNTGELAPGLISENEDGFLFQKYLF